MSDTSDAAVDADGAAVARLSALLACADAPVEALVTATNALKHAPPAPDVVLLPPPPPHGPAPAHAPVDALLALAAAWLAREPEGGFDNVLFCVAIVAEVAGGAMARAAASNVGSSGGGAARARRAALSRVLAELCPRLCRLRAQLQPANVVGACVHAMLALAHALALVRAAKQEPEPAELAELAATFLVRASCAFAPLAAQTDVAARAEALLGELRSTMPGAGGAAELRAALIEVRAAASRASLTQALRVARDALHGASSAVAALADEGVLADLLAVVEDGAESAAVAEQGLAAVNNVLCLMQAAARGSRGAGFRLHSPRLLRRLLAAAARALGGLGAQEPAVAEQASRVLLQLLSSDPFAQADMAAALVGELGVLGSAALALEGAARGGRGLRGPAGAAQGAAVHTLRLLGALALSPSKLLAPGALVSFLEALKCLFEADAGPGEAAAAVYAAAGELVARLLALDSNGGSDVAPSLHPAVLALGAALEGWASSD